MPLAISEEHRALAETVEAFLIRHEALVEARAFLELDDEPLSKLYGEVAELGWLGLHVSEEHGGSGFSLEELVVVLEQLGRFLAPGPYLSTVIASSLLEASAPFDDQVRHLVGLCDGTLVAGVGLAGELELRDGTLSGSAPAVLGAALAGLLVITTGDDVALVEASQAGVVVEQRSNLDPSRRVASVHFDHAAAVVLPGARGLLLDRARLLGAAEAAGVAISCTAQAAEYASTRLQFGRPIGTFQAVKHHCANMLAATELAVGAVWDAARAAGSGGEQATLAAAMAATLALDAADRCSQLNTQVHGGIAMTWEHDAHLFIRRATALRSLLDVEAAAMAVSECTRRGVRRVRSVDLPPEAEAFREPVRAFLSEIASLEKDEQKERMIETGYAVPNWPAPWGRDASAIEQLVIEQEFSAAGIRRPAYGITGWVILTLIQHGTEDQVARWVRSALTHEVIWCQLFSEPDAGSDAAGIKSRATRVDGGWVINGQKVWTSGAHVAKRGLATVRTDPDAPKHQGITTMVIDMHADGVEVRPIKMPSGASDFNEVFFTDVFVPDDDVVGTVNDGWTVARATLGNESVSIGGSMDGLSTPGELLLAAHDEHPERLPGGDARIGRYVATHQAISALNLRSAHRAVSGGGPGPEGNVTKLMLSEIGHDAAGIWAATKGTDGLYAEGPGAAVFGTALANRALSIAGGTSEIKRNQIGERILGLPRDPLIS
jgi:alkylation response protein AidB-like acyl-CoA dehydrogenase